MAGPRLWTNGEPSPRGASLAAPWLGGRRVRWPLSGAAGEESNLGRPMEERHVAVWTARQHMRLSARLGPSVRLSK